MSPFDWEFHGKSEKIGVQTHFRQAIAERRNGAIEKYSIGDCATMLGFDGKVWVGMITDMYDDPSKEGDLRRRVILRWFYASRHLNMDTHVERDVPRDDYTNELYFTDDVDYGDECLNVIDGKVTVYQDVNAFKRERRRGANCYLVRSFYKPTPYTAPRLRLLQPGELRFLLHNPGNKEMYDRYARACGVRIPYMPKRNRTENRAWVTKPVSPKRSRGGNRQVRRVAVLEQDEVEDENPRRKGKENHRGILAVMFSKDQRFQRG